MEYLTTFLWGFVSFLSPCMLPMLPIYLSYFSKEHAGRARTFALSISFVAGFSVVFCSLGLFVGSLGALLSEFHKIVETVGGIIIILLGFNALGLFHLPHGKGKHFSPKITGSVSAFLFGVVFSISHIPCVGAFLGTALTTAGISGSMSASVLLLLSYSLGMGVPFLICALVFERLEPFIEKMKKTYRGVSLFCGVFFIFLGIMMATGLLHKILHV